MEETEKKEKHENKLNRYQDQLNATKARVT